MYLRFIDNGLRHAGRGLPALGLALLTACAGPADGLAEGEAGSDGTVALNLTTRPAADARPLTRAAGDPADDTEAFPSRNEPYNMGLWVCEHEEKKPPSAFKPAMTGYGHIKAALSVGATGNAGNKDGWRYTFDGREHVRLGVRKGSAVDIYTYYPYADPADGEAAPPVTAIPFKGVADDLMWAEPVNITAEDTKDGTPVDVPLRLRHAMTCIQVVITCKYPTIITLKSITLKDTKDKRLCTAGTMNALTGELTRTEFTDSVTLATNVALNGSPTVNIFLPSVAGYADKEFVLSFNFDGVAGKTAFAIPATMKDADGNDITIKAFETGTRYRYTLTLDNIKSFAPVGFDTGWPEGSGKDIDIEL